MSVLKYKDPITGEWKRIGVNGQDGKSAYVYAQDGGYLGTEAEFAEKLAEESPKAFYVNIISMDERTVDKTDAEIEAAVQAGKSVYLFFQSNLLTGDDAINQTIYLQLTSMTVSDGLTTWVFEGVFMPSWFDGARPSYLAMSVAGGKIVDAPMQELADHNLIPATLPNPYTLNIDGVQYSGAEFVNYTDIINSMISAKTDSKAKKETGVYYIEGSGTLDSTNKVAAWTGSHDDISSYYNGLMIAYKVGVAASTTTTLNINGLGAVTVVRNATTALSTVYPVNSVVFFVYTTDSSGTAYWKAHEYDANTRNTVGDYRKNATKLYFVGTTSSDSATSSSYATSYTNSYCYVGTDNCLYSNGNKVAIASEIPTALKNPNALTINGKTYDGSEAVNIEISGGSTSEVNALGQTPITLAAEANVKLVADGECSYTAKGATVADLSTATIANTTAKFTQHEDYIELTATSGNAWYEAYANVTVSGLTAGSSYTLCVQGLGIDPANGYGGSHYIVKTSSGTTLTALSVDNTAFHSVAFTPTSSSVIITCYPCINYYWATEGCRATKIGDFYVNETSEGTVKTEIFNRSGTFTNSYILGEVPKGITITSDPSCEVYGTETIGDDTTDGATSPLNGKTVVCFGDSLFGMYRGQTSAPYYVAKRTGAIVHNIGFGGCRMSIHPTTGYAEFSMWALAKSIADGSWTSQDSAASSGSDYFPEQLALLKSIDFNLVDAIVIHYGTNDFTAGTSLDNASNSIDCNTLCGALRYSIEKLLTAYPNLRIFISVPAFRYWTASNGTVTYSNTYTNSGGKTLVNFVEAIASTAKEYNLPVIDSYYGLGINKINASTFLADGVHHNVEGRQRFGGYIGSRLIAEW